MKADSIKARDKHHCKLCGCTQRLEVHHLKYTKHYPWTEPDENLVTLCHNCHTMAGGYDKEQLTKQVTPFGIVSYNFALRWLTADIILHRVQAEIASDKEKKSLKEWMALIDEACRLREIVKTYIVPANKREVILNNEEIKIVLQAYKDMEKFEAENNVTLRRD